MLAVGFVILFSGVLNGYLAVASAAALLSYILAAMVAGRRGDDRPAARGLVDRAPR